MSEAFMEESLVIAPLLQYLPGAAGEGALDKIWVKGPISLLIRVQSRQQGERKLCAAKIRRC